MSKEMNKYAQKMSQRFILCDIHLEMPVLCKKIILTVRPTAPLTAGVKHG